MSEIFSTCCSVRLDAVQQAGVTVGFCARCRKAVTRTNPRTGVGEYLNGEPLDTWRADLEPVLKHKLFQNLTVSALPTDVRKVVGRTFIFYPAQKGPFAGAITGLRSMTEDNFFLFATIPDIDGHQFQYFWFDTEERVWVAVCDRSIKPDEQHRYRGKLELL